MDVWHTSNLYDIRDGIEAMSGNGSAMGIFVDVKWLIDFNHPRGIFVRRK